jgi:hypothetical protein
MKKNVFYTLFVLFTFISCGGDDNSSSSNLGNNENAPDNTGSTTGSNSSSSDWLIPTREVKDGGPGKDGIPSIDNPKFILSTDVGANYLTDENLVIGIVSGDEVKAYPHLILDWHEIANDEINGEFIALNYCPLTGTAFSWDRELKGQVTTFGVSGLLYNANLIPYDRLTDSNWSQLKLQCVNGELKSDVPRTIKVVETTWGMWKKLYPQTKVLSTNTGFSRSYGIYPYGDYNTNNDNFIFNVSPLNNALPNKERVFAIINNNKSKVYRFSDFGNGKAIKDSFNGKAYLIVGNAEVISSYELTGEFVTLDYQYDFNNSDHFFKDNQGNKYTIFGEVIEGVNIGEKLKENISVTSYWFAIAAFYPDPEIY